MTSIHSRMVSKLEISDSVRTRVFMYPHCRVEIYTFFIWAVFLSERQADPDRYDSVCQEANESRVEANKRIVAAENQGSR